MTQKLALYIKLMRLDWPIGTLLLLWPTLWAVWIASDGFPSWHILLIFTVGPVIMHSAGCIVNDYADRNFDPHVRRTTNRPLAAGQVSHKEAFILVAGLMFIALLLILPLNYLTWLLAIVALFLAGSYPFTKRFFAIPQAYLGIAYSFGIPMAFAAVQERVPALAWYMLVANVLWTIAYDTEYAMNDREDDLKIGIKTSAITFGRFDVLAVMLCLAGFLGIFTLIGLAQNFSWYYFAGIGLAGLLVIYQYGMIRTREPQRCFDAFWHNNWVGVSIFAGIVAHYCFSAV